MCLRILVHLTEYLHVYELCHFQWQDPLSFIIQLVYYEMQLRHMALD